MTGYTTREVAEVLGLTPRQVRGYARSGVLDPSRGPRNEYRFTFQDVILLRAARELGEDDLSTRKIRTALQRLRVQLPEGRPLSAVRITAEGDEVVVRDRDTAWEPATGQVTLDFAVEELASRMAAFAPRAARERVGRGDLDPDDWYDLGLELEAVSPEEARKAYRSALAARPDHVEANLNLGRLLHEAGELRDAEARYRRARSAAPDRGLAAYNLGVALEDLGRAEEAAEEYRAATELEPGLAAAHFNLARLLERAGRRGDAIRHLATYRRLTAGAG